MLRDSGLAQADLDAVTWLLPHANTPDGALGNLNSFDSAAAASYKGSGGRAAVAVMLVESSGDQSWSNIAILNELQNRSPEKGRDLRC